MMRRPRKRPPVRFFRGRAPPRPPPHAGEPGESAAGARTTVEYKQDVDVLFAFHKAGYKPNARSYNVAQLDVTHYLKYGTVLYGEWIIDGQRVPLASGEHQTPLPEGLTEMPRPPRGPFPNLSHVINVTDGCPNQFDYGTNHHQTAEWRTRTAEWALEKAKARRVEAVKQAQAAGRAAATARARATTRQGSSESDAVRREAASTSLSEAIAALEAMERKAAQEGAAEAASALTSALAQARFVEAATEAAIESDGLCDAISRTHCKLIEYHGKAAYDTLGTVPKRAVAEAVAKGVGGGAKDVMIDPDTRDMMLYLAKHKRRPNVAKADKPGWEAPGRYIWAFYDSKLFTQLLVPDAKLKGCQENHEFVGLCQDSAKAEKDGPMQMRKVSLREEA